MGLLRVARQSEIGEGQKIVKVSSQTVNFIEEEAFHLCCAATLLNGAAGTGSPRPEALADPTARPSLLYGCSLLPHGKGESYSMT